MVFRAFGTTSLAYEWKLKWVKLFYLDVRFFNSLPFCKTRNSFSAVKAIKRIFWGSSSIDVVTYTPPNNATMFARVFGVFNFIFPRGISHEAMPVL